MATNNNEFFATSYERKVKLYQRYDFNNEFDLAPYGNNYGLEFFNDVTNRLIQIGKTEIHAYDLNDLGVLLNHSLILIKPIGLIITKLCLLLENILLIIPRKFLIPT